MDVTNNQFYHNTIVDSEWDCVLLRAADFSGTAAGPGSAANNRFEYNIFYGPSGGNASYREFCFKQDDVNGWEGNIVQYNQFFAAGKPVLRSLVPSSVNNTLAQAAAAYPSVFGSGAAIGREGDPLFVDRANGNYNLQSGSPARDIGPGISGQTYNGQADAGAFEFTGGGGNIAPTATITSISNRTPTVNTAVSFQGVGGDPDGTIAAYEWDFGDASGSTQQNPSHTYTSLGQFTVRFRVRDNGNAFCSLRDRHHQRAERLRRGVAPLPRGIGHRREP